MNGQALLFYFSLFILLVGLLCLHFVPTLSKWFLLPPIVALGYVIAFIWLTISSISWSFGMIEDHACEAIHDIKGMIRTSLSSEYLEKIHSAKINMIV